MERIVEQNLLYDFYGELLTEHQKEVYGEHVENDMTPSEIAADYGITRQAAYDMIRRCNRILEDYEERLHLVQKFLTTKDKVKEIHSLSKRLLDEDKEQMKEDIRQIEFVSNKILEDL
ncbi:MULTISPECIES: YlxM family DNA-binding protein [Anaerostipes]|uniref:YlxM family DNA-binding protein n=1 Tax=Anaerostipes TaxID=207244 RepID=UPI0009532178|nr:MULTISPECIES: DNA-binding protein [Anaerostipes]MCI5622337.1 DNA-binding protein [Anaerostipes sp.]MDY2725276.1 DNA-binding protein [Anaerostipes faecalis]OLR58162.1 DNA-binding protein [Anaerostipes sp. 494a]